MRPVLSIFLEHVGTAGGSGKDAKGRVSEPESTTDFIRRTRLGKVSSADAYSFLSTKCEELGDKKRYAIGLRTGVNCPTTHESD